MMRIQYGIAALANVCLALVGVVVVRPSAPVRLKGM